MMMARWKSPRAAGKAVNIAVLPPPPSVLPPPRVSARGRHAYDAIDRAAGLGCFRMGGAAVRFAELRVLGRSLKRVANGIVVGNDDCGRLMAVHQQQGKPRVSREPVLNLRPRGRGILAVFLSIWGNGGLLH